MAEGTARPAEAPEERLWVGRPGLLSHFWKVAGGLLLLFGSLAAGLLLSLPLPAAGVGVAIGLLLLGAAWIGVIRYRYEITNRRAMAREGLFSQTTSEIQLDDVRNVLVHKSLSDRILRLGTVALSTAGQSGMEILFRSVEDPHAVVALINEHNP